MLVRCVTTRGWWSCQECDLDLLAQVFDCVSQILLADLIGKEGVAGASEKNEADFTGGEFFVSGEAIEDGFGGDGSGENRGKLIVGEEVENLERVSGIEI